MPASPDCPPTERWQALFDEAVSPEERAAFERHLETCAACQARLEQPGDEGGDGLLTLLRRSGRANPPPPDPALTQVLERLYEGNRSSGAAPGEPADLFFLGLSEHPDVLGRLGGYEVLEVIGQGGMGLVLKALDPGLNRFVAIKVMAAALAGSATARHRFTREARAAAAVCHEHVVAVHGVHEVEGLPYLVMQYVAGESLQERLDRTGPLEEDEAVRIAYQTASGLAAAHAQGLIHRDIKPANLLLENGVARVKITDFGLARMADDIGLTRDGVVAGTPQYMAPEQARGEAVDHRADLYSLGAVLYACCTGQPPFRGASAVAVLRRVSDEQPAPIRTRNPRISAWLEALIARLMAKDRAERFQSAAEVAGLLEGYLAHLRQPAACPAPPLLPVPRRRPPRGRFRPGVWLLGILVLAAGLLGARALAPLAPPPPEPPLSGELYQDFRGGRMPTPPLQIAGTDAQAFTRPEAGGFRITLPRDRKAQDRVGLNMTTRIQGDFEITAGYEILQVGQPVQGHGVAFALLVETDSPRHDVVELTRTTRAGEGEVYNCARISTDDEGKRTYQHQFPPASGDRGRLRLKRTGPEVTLSAAEGDAGAFTELATYDLGPEDVTLASAAGFTGYAPNLLDLRILDLRVRSFAQAADPDASSAQPPKGASRPWLAAAGLIGLMLLLAALGVWLATSRRRRSRPAPVPDAVERPRPPAPLVSFLCPGCGHDLKVKAELAGKKGKCPRCGNVLLVPAPVQEARPGHPPS